LTKGAFKIVFVKKKSVGTNGGEVRMMKRKNGIK